MDSPLIGLSTSRFNNSGGIPMVATTQAYVQAVAAAGGLPLLIPTGIPMESALAEAGRMDGILLTGGSDVDPRRYNGKAHDRVEGVDQERDELEIALVRHVIDTGKPFLGICRGAQVINVALGGSLYADIADQYGRSLRHDWLPKYPRTYIAHTVDLEPGSRIALVLGETRLEVNSLHHQAVRQLAPGLTACGYAPDGLVEALELAGHPFGIAVQWHPEWLTASAPAKHLFAAFCEAAAAYRTGRG